MWRLVCFSVFIILSDWNRRSRGPIEEQEKARKSLYGSLALALRNQSSRDVSQRAAESAQRARVSAWPFNQPLGSEIWGCHTRRSSASFICFQSSRLSSSGCGRVGILIRDREGGSGKMGLMQVNEKTVRWGRSHRAHFCVLKCVLLKKPVEKWVELF